MPNMSTSVAIADFITKIAMILSGQLFLILIWPGAKHGQIGFGTSLRTQILNIMILALPVELMPYISVNMICQYDMMYLTDITSHTKFIGNCSMR